MNQWCELKSRRGKNKHMSALILILTLFGLIFRRILIFLYVYIIDILHTIIISFNLIQRSRNGLDNNFHNFKLNMSCVYDYD